MDTMLIAVTGVSLALAAAMGVLLARMIREERQRSEARVQLLERLADTGDTSRVSLPTPVAQDFRFASVPLQRTDLFYEDPQPSPWPRRLAVIGSFAALLTLAVFGWTQIRATAPTPADVATAATTPAPLELLSLRHSREGNTLVITGLVQNPQKAAALSNLQATVFVFGPGGTFLTSGRAPVDFTSITPGDESPFVVRVPVTGEVSRYRVGFRGPDDRVVGHVDRRSDQVGRKF